MTAAELADEITERGKNLGKQATSNVIGALKRYIVRHERFYREIFADTYVYGLLEWKKDGEKERGTDSRPDS